MLDFIIVGLPRSGTTWASNLFSTENVLCHHDPLYTTHYNDWDEALPKGVVKTGVSCTGIWRWPDWVNQHKSRKVILHRDLNEIEKSMRQIGLPPLDFPSAEKQLQSLKGLHIDYTDLFNSKKCCDIWNYLLEGAVPFGVERHKLLIDIEMQPKFAGLTVGKDVTRKLMIELASILE